MRTKFVAFDRVESAFEEGAEDSGLHVAPIGTGSFYKERKLVVS